MVSLALVTIELKSRKKEEENGRTPLFIAIFNRNDKSAITLLENGADITVNNNYGVSPMSLVTKKVKKWINENLITNSKPTE